jgi:hypothetical protein
MYLGGVIAAFFMYLGIQSWTSESAVWFVKRGPNIVVHSHSAKAFAIAYSSVGFFFHFRWFWGLLPSYRVFNLGTLLSLLGFIGGLSTGIYYHFFV